MFHPTKILFKNPEGNPENIESQKTENLDASLREEVKDLSTDDLEARLKEADAKLDEANQKNESFQTAEAQLSEPKDISEQIPGNFSEYLNMYDRPTMEQYEKFAANFPNPPKYSDVGKTIQDKYGRTLYMEFPGDNPTFEEVKGEQKVHYINSKGEKSEKLYSVDSMLKIKDSGTTYHWAVIFEENARPQNQIVMVEPADETEKDSPTDISEQLPEGFREHLTMNDKPTREQYEKFTVNFPNPPKYSEVGKTIQDKLGRVVYMEFPGDNPIIEEEKGEKNVRHIKPTNEKSEKKYSVKSMLTIKDSGATYHWAVIFEETANPQTQVVMVQPE